MLKKIVILALIVVAGINVAASIGETLAQINCGHYSIVHIWTNTGWSEDPYCYCPISPYFFCDPREFQQP